MIGEILVKFQNNTTGDNRQGRSITYIRIGDGAVCLFCCISLPELPQSDKFTVPIAFLLIAYLGTDRQHKFIYMKKLFIPLLMVFACVNIYAQDTRNSWQANILYGSKIKTAGFGVTFNLTGKKHEFSPSINVFLPKDDVKVREINFDYHRLYNIGEKVRVFPIIGFGLAVWDGFGGEGNSALGDNDTKFGANLGIGGRYTLNERFDVGFQLKYSAMSSSGSQTVPMVTISYKL
ncbi:hypothetical protein D0T84_20440 [Dysgonomonas sp. 521]|uniref:outer membrane beta-barrel protein n=1 Tax=Dysgonomonas sp. 521 TaxID=2302932 RepID=UPI0013D4FDC5|nr:outer membrane beta-barrel protein [Dysgonomonas sp. 521]NDV97252.1 hypothetical protein [Dysgonomonas sp. 521]